MIWTVCWDSPVRPSRRLSAIFCTSTCSGVHSIKQRAASNIWKIHKNESKNQNGYELEQNWLWLLSWYLQLLFRYFLQSWRTLSIWKLFLKSSWKLKYFHYNKIRCHLVKWFSKRTMHLLSKTHAPSLSESFTHSEKSHALRVKCSPIVSMQYSVSPTCADSPVDSNPPSARRAEQPQSKLLVVPRALCERVKRAAIGPHIHPSTPHVETG